jgi:hypothetical protein
MKYIYICSQGKRKVLHTLTKEERMDSFLHYKFPQSPVKKKKFPQSQGLCVLPYTLQAIAIRVILFELFKKLKI